MRYVKKEPRSPQERSERLRELAAWLLMLALVLAALSLPQLLP